MRTSWSGLLCEQSSWVEPFGLPTDCPDVYVYVYVSKYVAGFATSCVDCQSRTASPNGRYSHQMARQHADSD